MATLVGTVDGMLKEYLLFRGFTGTLKSFETELKADKDKSLRVEKIIDQIQAYITSYDLNGLRNYWTYLDKRFFLKLSGQGYHNIKLLEAGVLRLYLVYAVQSSKTEKVFDFFDKLASDLHGVALWKEWFAIPFIKNPEQNPLFSMYFTKVWQESLLLGLYNCIDTILSRMSLPTLLNFEIEKERVKRIEEENTSLQEQIAGLLQEIIKLKSSQRLGKKDAAVQVILTKQELDYDYTTVNSRQSLIPSITTPLKIARGRIGWKTKPPPKDTKKWKKIADCNLNGNKKDEKYEKDRKELLNGRPRIVSEILPGRHENQEHEQTKTLDRPHNLPLLHPINSLPETSELLESPEVNQQQEEPPGRGDQRESSVFFMSLGEKTTNPTSLFGQLTQKIASSLPILTKSDKPSLPPKVETDAKSTSATVSSIVNVRGEVAPVGDDEPYVILSQEVYTDHKAAVSCCQFSHKGTSVASIDVSGIVKIWEYHPKANTVATIIGKPQAICFGWIPKVENTVLVGKSNGKIVLYDTNARKPKAELTIDSKFQRISCILANPNGTSFICSAASSVSSLVSPRSSSFSVKTPTLGRKLAKSKSDSDKLPEGTLYAWDLESLTLEVELALEPYPVAVHSLAYNKKGTLMVCGGADGMIRLFDVKTNDCLVGWHAHTDNVLDIRFSNDESSIYSLGADRKLCVWDVRRVSFKMEEHFLHSSVLGLYDGLLTGNVSEIMGSNWPGSIPTGRLFAFDSEGKYIMLGSKSTSLIYEVSGKSSFTPIMQVEGNQSPVTCLDWTSSPNCSTCITGQQNGNILMTTLLRQ